jgi:hypothetical protein
MPAARQAIEPEALDKGRFAGTGRAGDADPRGASGPRQDRLDQPLGFVAMVGTARLDEGDGAGQRAPLAAAQRRGEVVSRGGNGPALRTRQLAASAASRRAASCWRAHIAA